MPPNSLVGLQRAWFRIHRYHRRMRLPRANREPRFGDLEAFGFLALELVLVGNPCLGESGRVRVVLEHVGERLKGAGSSKASPKERLSI